MLASIELIVPVAAALWLLRREVIRAQGLFFAAVAVLIAGGLYRLDTALVAFMPGSEFRYFPSVPEILVTVGFSSAAILAYIVIVKRFAILPARPAESPV
jgi:Ni/Fe-hydrogenase subunit HybB-like protein